MSRDKIHIDSRIRELVVQHGSLRAVARSMNINASYLSRLMSGQKVNPSDAMLLKLGLKRVDFYTSADKPVEAVEVGDERS